MLELSNLCHCIQHPWKLTSRDVWNSRNERKPLSMQKFVFRKCSEVSQTQWMLEFQTFAIVFSTPENLLVGISGALEMKEIHFLRKKIWRKWSGISLKQWMIELSNLSHCVQHPWKFNSRDFWSSRMKGSHFLSKNVFWENAAGYLKNGEC